MSRLAPGRRADMQRLLTRRDSYLKHSENWDINQRRIEDLVEEGRCDTMHSLRGRLVNAAIAKDNDAILHISHEIDEHMLRHHRQRFMRNSNVTRKG